MWLIATIRVRGDRRSRKASMSSRPSSSTGDEDQLHTLALAQEMPRHDVGVVLHLAEQDLVAGPEVAAEGRGHQVDRLGGALGEDDLADIGGVDEAAHGLACSFIAGGRLVRERVQSAVDVGVGRLAGPGHGLHHGRRLLRRGCGIEVDQGLAVDLSLQDRELRPCSGDVETHDAAPSLAATQPRATSRAASCAMRSTTVSTKARVSMARASPSGMPRWAA